MIRRIFPALFFVIACAASTAGIAQRADDTLHLVQTLPVNARFAVTDNLGNIYLINAENAVEKYAPDGRLLTRYSSNRLGSATMLDVSNPLKVLVWYADFRTALFLDRSLTALGELNLITAGYPEVRAIAASRDGNLWLYDEVNFRLAKVTPDGEKRFESQALNQLGLTPGQVSCILENNDRVYMADSTQGLLIFDLFAQFDRIFTPAWPVTAFQVVDQQIHYVAQDSIVMEHLRVRASREIALPAVAGNGAEAILAPRRLLLIRKDAVEIWGY
ncbi:MAG: hypothetical protein IPK76_05760 [Lewinellaceae bacterium]|jgi:hypothetical protein|nr:hypothetical protein [Lewinellaceae bacterium]